MLITEMIQQLEEIKKEHGDMHIFLADRYLHYEIKYINFSDDIAGPHVCIRMEDSIRYDDN